MADYLKKETIIQMDDDELINAFEETVGDMTKAINFSARGIPQKLSKQCDWIREEILVRMR